MPTFALRVAGTPPIKRGEESMWGTQREKIKALRREAAQRIPAPAGPQEELELEVIVYADRSDGDLDGFVSGICDALQGVHPNYAPYLREKDWSDLPREASPPNVLGFRDDDCVRVIRAERRTPERSEKRYEVCLAW